MARQLKPNHADRREQSALWKFQTCMDISIVIATANRSAALGQTLSSLASVRQPGRVELLVVDNRSADETRKAVERAAADYPFPVRYLFEGEEGKYAALNAGIRASRGRFIA